MGKKKQFKQRRANLAPGFGLLNPLPNQRKQGFWKNGGFQGEAGNMTDKLGLSCIAGKDGSAKKR